MTLRNRHIVPPFAHFVEIMIVLRLATDTRVPDALSACVAQGFAPSTFFQVWSGSNAVMRETRTLVR
jgi:hypothetical protein